MSPLAVRFGVSGSRAPYAAIVVVRCTAKMLALLGVRRSELADVEPVEDDWYANLLWIERRKCVLLTHAGTAFSLFVPDVRKADLARFGPWVEAQVISALDDEQQPRDVLGPIDGGELRVAATASRRVLGLMNDIAFNVEHFIRLRGGLAAIDAVELNRQLQRTLHRYHDVDAEPLDLIEQRRSEGSRRRSP